MGLTSASVGIKAVDSGLEIKKQSESDLVVAIAGNPNVGKSTLFNNLTGMNQHTGNWPGKTVANAQGHCTVMNRGFVMVDIPGTYSLMAHSAEEEVARNFICFGQPDATVVVCDATCLERNLNLVLQTIEISGKTLVCVNLLDEAKRKNISIDLKLLSERLGVPVVGTIARKKKTLDMFLKRLCELTDGSIETAPLLVRYDEPIERAIALLEPVLRERVGDSISPRWLALKLLDFDDSLISEINRYFQTDLLADPRISDTIESARSILKESGMDRVGFNDSTVASVVRTAEQVCRGVVTSRKNKSYNSADRRIDRILTSKWTGYPVMLLMLAVIFWITIAGANYPSAVLSGLFSKGEVLLSDLFISAGAPDWLRGALVSGVYRVLTWVVSVMLPPMAIFFPLFTLLEDVGYLPRVAYNLDKPFKKCKACGKQALSMCMGFGCNAAGVVGCRIIDSPRERIIAILTNNFVPCNGRFPAIITLITMFFIGSAGVFDTALSALALTAVILLGILITFAVSRLLSETLLKGMPSSFTLELPPYRRPQIGRVIVRSVFDRTLFVLGRAAAVAAPAGLIIWLMANVTVADASLLSHCSAFLDPFGRLLGMDGVILIAFILGFPANEIVIPIILMAYTAQGSLVELDSVMQMKELFIQNGWTWVTAVSVMLFSLLHWPCSTTMLTIRKETGSVKWTAVAMLLPTVIGIVACFLFASVARLFI